jgi:hypothetical protein
VPTEITKAVPSKRKIQKELDTPVFDFSHLTPEQIDARLEELRIGMAEDDAKLAAFREGNKIEFIKPIEPYQTRILEYLHAGKKIISLVGANGIGKTHLGAMIVGSACLGIQPWDLKPTVWGKRPVKCRIICSDWEKHAATVIVPKLKELLPAGTYTTSKNNVGVESKWDFGNKSSVELITNKQATSDHEGWEGDLIWADEPFDRDKFVANLRGLRRPPEKGGMGVFLITMTAVSQAWILDDIILNNDPAYASVTEIPQDANPHLGEEYKRIFRASLKEDEKIARIDGGWLNLFGLILKGFKADVHLIKPFLIPTDWPVVAMIDFHLGTPQAIGYYATDPVGITYVIHEEWESIGGEEVADLIIRHKKSDSWRIEDAFIDPLSKGDTQYVKNRFGDVPDSFSIIRDRLDPHGITLSVATKDKSSGILNVEKMLVGPNGRPTLFFFADLPGNVGKIQKEGHVWEIQRWVYDDNGKPKDENDHFMENLYRMTLTGVKWTPMRAGGSVRVESEFNVFA